MSTHEEHVHESHPTTTHAQWGAGNPRLLITNTETDERSTYDITTDTTTIGSAADNSVTLAGTDPLHATVDHDERDEYLVTLHGAGELSANPASQGDGSENRQTLRSGAHFTAGPWRFVYMRDEFADHGRPYGGREGGELDDQPGQPARPDYAHGESRPGPEIEVQDN